MFHSRLVLHRRWFFSLTLLAFFLALVTGGILWHSVGMSSVREMQVEVDSLKPIFTGIRFFLITLVAMVWSFVTNNLRCWGQIDESQATMMLVLRWRVVTWLVVIELMLGQNLLGQVLTVLRGSRV